MKRTIPTPHGPPVKRCPYKHKFGRDWPAFPECDEDKCDVERDCMRRWSYLEERGDPTCPHGHKFGKDLDQTDDCLSCKTAKKELCREVKERYEQRLKEEGPLLANRPFVLTNVKLLQVDKSFFLKASLFGLVKSFYPKGFWATNSEIAEYFGYSISAIETAVKDLKKLKLLRSEKHDSFGDSRRRTLKLGRNWEKRIDRLWERSRIKKGKTKK